MERLRKGEVPRTVLELKGDTVIEYRNVMMNVEVDERLRQALKDACKAKGMDYSKLTRKLWTGWLASQGIVVDYGREG